MWLGIKPFPQLLNGNNASKKLGKELFFLKGEEI